MSFGVKCIACSNIFVMLKVPAWEDHPEMARGCTIAPLCCPYCGEVESFSIAEKIRNILDAVITFAARERGESA